VGFTPGESDGNGTFVVHGFNGHAWPEVYLDGFGWVAFEPTPGRGMPGAESYTGIAEQQADVGNQGSATTLATTTTTAAETPRVFITPHSQFRACAGRKSTRQKY
jgi:transglutaminase-like putative cysteine protease